MTHETSLSDQILIAHTQTTEAANNSIADARMPRTRFILAGIGASCGLIIALECLIRFASGERLSDAQFVTVAAIGLALVAVSYWIVADERSATARANVLSADMRMRELTARIELEKIDLERQRLSTPQTFFVGAVAAP